MSWFVLISDDEGNYLPGCGSDVLYKGEAISVFVHRNIGIVGWLAHIWEVIIERSEMLSIG